MNSFKLIAVGNLARNPELVAKGDTMYTRFCLVGNDYAGKDEQLAVLRKGLAQILTSDLSSVQGIRLVERTRLEEVLGELKLGQNPHGPQGYLLDPKSAARVGKLLGAQYMVMGGYFDLGTLYFGAEYEMKHLPMPVDLQKNISYKFFVLLPLINSCLIIHDIGIKQGYLQRIVIVKAWLE